MRDELDRFDESLSVEALERIEPICQTFEDAWQSGQRPEMDSFLGEVNRDERAPLLRFLLPLDIVYRRQHGSDPLIVEYCDHFPDFAELISAVFRASAAEDREDVADEGPHDPLAVADQVNAVAGGPRCEEQGHEHLTCPHCGSDIQLDDPEQQEVTCVNCGSTIELDPKATTAYPILPKKIGRFEVLELVGRGAFGVVYKARDPQLHVTVAIKIPRAEFYDTKESAERFLRDARNAARLRNPNIVRAHDIEYERGMPYIICDYIDGMNLAERLTGERVGIREAVELVVQMADALDYAHSESVFHRDVKPSNILIDQKGRPYLTDFGLASKHEGDTEVTVTGQILGTPAYMSPEQARGEQVDGRSDVYSLGVVLYELLTGRLPFRGNCRMTLHQVLNVEPRPPRRVDRDIPRDLETICLKCLEKELTRRYASARELANELRLFLDYRPIEARRISPTARTWRWCKRNPLVTVLCAGILVLIAILIVGSIFSTRKAEVDKILAVAKPHRQRIQDRFQVFNEGRIEEFTPKMLGDTTPESQRPDLSDLAGEFIPYYLRCLDHPDRRVQQVAAEVLGDLGPDADRPDVIDSLHRMQFDSDGDVRRAAIEALEKIKKPPID